MLGERKKKGKKGGRKRGRELKCKSMKKKGRKNLGRGGGGGSPLPSDIPFSLNRLSQHFHKKWEINGRGITQITLLLSSYSLLILPLFSSSLRKEEAERTKERDGIRRPGGGGPAATCLLHVLDDLVFFPQV